MNAQHFYGQVRYVNGAVCKDATVTFYNNYNFEKKVSVLTDDEGNYDVTLSQSPKNDLLYAFAIRDDLAQKINFECAFKEESMLKVWLCDIQGRRIVELFSDLCTAGIQNFSWDYSFLAHELSNSIYLINFTSDKTQKTIKFAQFGSDRLDFYREKLQENDFSINNNSDVTYTAEVSGSDFEKHISRKILASSEKYDFVIDKNSTVPFKCGNTYIEQYNGESYKPFYLKGINLGAAIPGTSPSEMAPTSEQYAKWFKMMSTAGYNLIRIYTLHYPRFYDELKKFNETHPASPLYLMHGAWLDEEYEGFEGQADLYSSHIWFVRDVNQSTELESQTIIEYFDNRIKEVIDVVHGNAQLPERWGWASGKYSADVSPWLLGYIMGREIYANEVVSTNTIHPEITSYAGDVFSLEKGTATEVWATERLDRAMTYERDVYQQQHPISFSSWPTLDPIDHPSEWGPEDIVEVNLDGINETNSPAGYFASYHVYPYFPDFMVCDEGYQTYSDYLGENSYLGYLYDLKSHYQNRPLIISEFGVSSSWGTSRFSSNGMHHGGLTEQEQGEYIVRMMHNIKEAKCGGGILFSWIDEWFKYVWIFGDNTDPTKRNRWHNIYSAEENYGLISFIPEEADFSEFGFSSNAKEIDQIRVSADIEALYIKTRLKKEMSSNDTLWLAIDTYNKGKGESVLPNMKTVYNRSEFCVRITNKDGQLYVTKAYDMYGIGQSGFPVAGQYFRSIATDGAGWNEVRWKNHRDEDFCAGSVFEAGKLRIRNNDNPLRGDAVIFNDKEVVVKLPWAMINFNDPSRLNVTHITDYVLNGGENFNQTAQSDGIAVTAFLGNSKVSTPRFVWEKWDQYSMPKTVEYKKSSYYIVKEALKNFPEEID